VAVDIQDPGRVTADSFESSLDPGYKVSLRLAHVKPKPSSEG